MFRVFGIALFVIFSSLFTTASASAGWFSVCNNSDNKLRAIQVVQILGAFRVDKGSTASGHYDLKPNTCHDIRLKNYQWAWVGVYDEENLILIEKKLDKTLDDTVINNLTDESKRTVSKLLFPYTARGDYYVKSVCVDRLNTFDYHHTSVKDYEDECKAGFFRIPIIVQSRGGDNNAKMNLN